MNIAIVLGVSQYSGALTSLPACKNDAEAMSALLRGDSRFAEVLLLADNTTADAVKQRIVEFVARHKSAVIDEVLFYFSGHGDFAGTEFYYLLSDYDPKRRSQTSFENSEVDRLLRSLTPKLAVKIVDACASGMTYIKEPAALETYLKGTQQTFKFCYFMFSSHSDQASYADPTLSFFTRSLVDAVLAHSAASIRYKDVIDHISDAFEGNSQQKPLFVTQADFTEQFCAISDETRTALRRAAHISDVADVNVDGSPGKTIARRSPAAPAAPEQDAIETDLVNRLAKLKRFVAVGSAEHFAKLKERIDAVAKGLQQRKDQVRSFGLEKVVEGPRDIYYTLSPFSEHIVRSVESAGYRPLHRVKSERETHQPLQTKIADAMGFMPPPPTTKTEYILEQRSNYPDSCVTLETSSDSHVPRGILFLYLLPLQLRACLYGGVAVKGEANASEDDWSLKSLTHILLDLDDTDSERIDHFIAKMIAAFNDMLRGAVARRVKVLEDEKDR